MSNRTDLSEKMHALADTGHPRASDLRDLADKFDAANAEWVNPTDGDDSIEGVRRRTKAQLGAWSRARRLWCDLTGEPLV